MARKRLSGPRAAFLEGAGQAPEVKSALKPLGGGPPIAQVAAQSAAEGALRELADEVSAAKSEGRMVLQIPLDQIAPDHLARDRVAQGDEDRAALVESIRSHGQRTPIEVTALEDGRYGLISGWRRLAALEELHGEAGDPAYGTVLALLRQPKDASDAYVSMVEENEIRVGLSYYERARVAAEATKRGVYDSEKQALLTLFANVSRAKRSRIRSFVRIYHALDGHLRFPAAIPERLGLSLVGFIKRKSGSVKVLRKALKAAAPKTPEEELSVLAEVISGQKAEKPPAPTDVPRAEQLPNGLKLILQGQKIVLSGDGVSEALFDRLKDLLSEAD